MFYIKRVTQYTQVAYVHDAQVCRGEPFIEHFVHTHTHLYLRLRLYVKLTYIICTCIVCVCCRIVI